MSFWASRLKHRARGVFTVKLTYGEKNSRKKKIAGKKKKNKNKYIRASTIDSYKYIINRRHRRAMGSMDAAADAAAAVLFVIYQCWSRPARVHYGDESRRKNETARGKNT